MPRFGDSFLVLSLCPDHGNLMPLGGERMHRSDRLGVLGKTVVINYSPGLEKYPGDNSVMI